MEPCTLTVRRIEIVLESIASAGGGIFEVRMTPTDWRVKFHEDRDQMETYDHVDRLSLVTGDATAQELSPIVLRRWSLVYEEDPQRFDLWTWRLPPEEPPTHDGQILIV